MLLRSNELFLEWEDEDGVGLDFSFVYLLLFLVFDSAKFSIWEADVLLKFANIDWL
jgi:hypothetical protein